ncbi:family 2A encapsulin nanocompartment cargo protein cysteine desulfurase [Sorangium sp. So ce1078]|uniref:family 2A encapsulin nanocompartment cargo protein cysteine desulfurase n=1 Tax=Sorangium sp. So ce1078 TaxID=3133329 RepID=UPI003F641F38
MNTSELHKADLQGALLQAPRAVGSSGISPLVTPPSVPGAAHASAPDVLGFDAAAMATVIAQLANEMLGAPMRHGGAALPAAPLPGAAPSLSPAIPGQAPGSVPLRDPGPSMATAPVYPGAAPGYAGAAPAHHGAVPAHHGAAILPGTSMHGRDMRVPLLGTEPLSRGVVEEVLRVPVLGDLPAHDARPYFMPSAPALGIESPVGAPRIEAHEIRAVDPALARGLRASAGIFDAHAIRRDFPILEERVHNRRLVWLDNAATTQKPQVVIDRLSHFYQHENSNIHRAAHALAARATDAYEAARETTRRFLNAPSTRDIVFVRGTTEGINLIAQTWGRRHVGPGDEIVITWLEHHANIVPWQQLCAEKGARLRVAPVDDRGQVILEEYEKLLGPRTRIVSLTQVSNALGTITPAREMVAMAHRHGARVLVDGAQAVSHMRADVQLLDCDFYVFSGHKVFGPTGIGVVYGKGDVLDAMGPWQGGGNMIADVTFERTAYQPPPARFEAGTGNIADAVGLGAALEYVTRIGLENISRYEHELLHYATHALMTVPGLRLIGTAPDKAGVLSFVLQGQRTEEMGGVLDREGIAVRSGHHCAQPILRRFGVEHTVRASLAPYNTCEDIDTLVNALHRIQTGRPS